MESRAARLDQVVHLSDGRILGYAEFGSNTAPPMFVFHGLPGSRLAIAEMWPEEPAGVRVIAPDRPGAGLSTFQPGRRLLDWANDVRQLADSLGVDRFIVAGFSAGGPHALAVAHGLPDRVIAVGTIAGPGPFDSPKALEGMTRANKLILRLARRAPRALWVVAAPHARQIRRQPAKAFEKAARDRSVPEADREVMTSLRLRERMVAAAPEAFRQGVRGFIHEAHVTVQPWGFDPGTIKPPARIWHGDKDTHVPVAMAQHLAVRMPGSSLTIYPGEGHLIVPRHWDEILAALLSYWHSPPPLHARG
jgi:pimeloyl-ACP methyl ester carboxylesterase